MWGTKEYFAPELIDQAYGPQADLWALGCILFEMLCGHQGWFTHESNVGKIIRIEIDGNRVENR